MKNFSSSSTISKKNKRLYRWYYYHRASIEALKDAAEALLIMVAAMLYIAMNIWVVAAITGPEPTMLQALVTIAGVIGIQAIVVRQVIQKMEKELM